MIFDWDKNAELVLKNKEYTDQGKNEYLQQIQTCTFLLQRRLSKDIIFKTWRQIPNHFINEVAADEYDIISYFNCIYKKAENNLSSYIKRQQRVKVLHIFQEEIDAINQMSADLSFRRYIFMLLGIFKFYFNYNGGHCYLDSKMRRYAFEQGNPGKTYRSWSYSLMRKNFNCGSVVKSITTKKGAISEIIILRTEGTTAIEYTTPDELIKHLNLIENRKITCTKCGKIFESYSEKRKRDICDDCYKKERSKQAKKCNDKKKELTQKYAN